MGRQMKALESRRGFLAGTGQGMVWLSLGGLAACGGGGDAPDPDAGSGGSSGSGSGSGSGAGSGGPVAGTPFTLAQRLATLDAVRERVASLAAGAPTFDNAALVQALRALPGLDLVGSSPAVGNVWARFTDGRYLVVPNNLLPPAPTGQAQAKPLAAQREQAAATGGDDMPAKLVAQQYRQLDMLGQVPSSSAVDAAHLCLDWVDADTLPKLRKMAVGCGFVLPEIQRSDPPDVGIDNGIDGLQTVGGDGVFFITGCAAQVGDDATPRSVICSGSAATEANLARHELALARGLLVFAVAMRGVQGSWEPVPCLAFGPEFVVEHRWRFPTESVAIFNLAGAPGLSDWVPTLYAAGVRHILAWARPVSWQRLLAFGDDLIQLNLATNNLDGRLRREPSEPRLRSYGIGETLAHLQRRGVASDGGAGDAVSYLQERQPALMVNSLLPTIDSVTLNENSLQIELVGQFGRAAVGNALSSAAPTQARLPAMVVVGTRDDGRFAEPLLARAADPLLEGWQALASPQWPGELLQTVLQRDDLARGGYVQVVNGGRCSNAVPITHWEIPIQAVTTIDELVLSLTVTLRLRADVHGWRLEPEGFARNGRSQGEMTASVHSRADYQASGSISHYDATTSTRTTITWSGSGGVSNAIGAFEVNASLTLLWDSRETLFLSLNVASARATHAQLTVTEKFDANGQLLRRTESQGSVPVSLVAAGPGSNGVFQFRFDPQWNLLAGAFEMPPVDSRILPAPPERMRRTRLTWPQVRPDFAPRRDFGGT